MASTDVRRPLERNPTQTLDPVGCRGALDGRLSGSEGLGEALRQRSEQGPLPSCPEGSCLPSVAADMGSVPLAPVPPSASLLSALPPVHPESAGSGGVGPRRGSASQSGSFHAGTPRTPLSAEYAQALQRNSQRLLEAVASSASSGLGGSAENPVPLPEQETLMLPLCAAQGGIEPADRVRVAAEAAAAAGEQPPSPGSDKPAGARRRAAGAENQLNNVGAAAAVSVIRALNGSAQPAAAPLQPVGSGDEPGAGPSDAPGSSTCPPFAVKATCGKRPIMEDTYALCPNIAELPMQPMAAKFADKLPQRIAVQLAAGEPSADQTEAEAAAGAVTAATGAADAATARPDGGLVGSGSAFGSSLAGSNGALEKLHFFGVYDGHGGVQASQHCAARLHHHLSASLRELATSFLGRDASGLSSDPAASPGGTGSASWRTAMVPEVQFVPVYRDPNAAPAGLLGGADDCLIAVAAAAAAAAEAGGGLKGSHSVSSAPDVSPEDEVALRALSRESSSAEDGEHDPAPAAEGDAGAGDDGADADAEGSEEGGSDEGVSHTSMCALLEEALREAFLKTDEEFAADGTAGLVGSTAVCALVGGHRVWIANCGDSRAVLCRGGQAVQVTDDHKPEREDEAARVEKAGGQVLYWNGHRVMGVLAMSRAIGDHCLRPYVIPEPEVTVFKRHAKDEILLLASDGLWDVMPNQEATDLAMRCIRRARDKGASAKAAARVAATILTKAAVDRGSRDNITVMIIDLSRTSRGSHGGSSDGEAPAAPQKPEPGSGGRLAAAAAAAEAAGARNRRPTPQRIIHEQPSITDAPPAPLPPQPQQQQQKQQPQPSRQQQHEQQHLPSEAIVVPAPKSIEAASAALSRVSAGPVPFLSAEGLVVTAQLQP